MGALKGVLFDVDGNGYPHGLKGEDIPLMARIIAVADTLDAMTTHRPYQTAMELEEALQLIRKKSGSKFDTSVVDALELVVQAGQIRGNCMGNLLYRRGEFGSTLVATSCQLVSFGPAYNLAADAGSARLRWIRHNHKGDLAIGLNSAFTTDARGHFLSRHTWNSRRLHAPLWRRRLVG